MPHRRRDAERAQRADAADAENDFLLQARFAIAAVESRGEIAILRRVLFEAGVEQVQRDAADRHFPDVGQHGAIAERHRDDARRSVGLQRLLDGDVGPVEPLVHLELPALGRRRLVEVSLRIHEADADQRHAEVARLLAVIAGEHAEAAGIDRQRLMNRELGREVRDRRVLQIGKAPRHPRVLRGVRRVEPFHRVVVRVEKFLVARHLLEALARDEPQHLDRIVRGRAPELVVEIAKHLARAVLPAPPEVGRELVEAADSFGYGRKTCVPSHRTMDRSRPRSLASIEAAAILSERRRAGGNPCGGDEAADAAGDD